MFGFGKRKKERQTTNTTGMLHAEFHPLGAQGQGQTFCTEHAECKISKDIKQIINERVDFNLRAMMAELGLNLFAGSDSTFIIHRGALQRWLGSLKDELVGAFVKGQIQGVEEREDLQSLPPGAKPRRMFAANGDIVRVTPGQEAEVIGHLERIKISDEPHYIEIGLSTEEMARSADDPGVRSDIVLTKLREMLAAYDTYAGQPSEVIETKPAAA